MHIARAPLLCQIIGVAPEMNALAWKKAMRYLPHTPRNFREIVLADLLRAQRVMVRIQDEIDPQFRIASPEGDWWIAMTLDANLSERRRQMRLISRFMAWKLSPAFTMASELIKPDAVISVGVSQRERHGVMSLIERNPLRFLPEQWLAPEQLDPEILALLPRGAISLTAPEIAEVEQWFGPNGKFPALLIGNE